MNNGAFIGWLSAISFCGFFTLFGIMTIKIPGERGKGIAQLVTAGIIVLIVISVLTKNINIVLIGSVIAIVIGIIINSILKNRDANAASKAAIEAAYREYEHLEGNEKGLASTKGFSKFNRQEYAYKEAEKEAEKAVIGLSSSIRSSAAQTKEVDWAIAGGLASGLGGSLAGVSAAADAMNKNAQIRETNRRNQEYVNRVANNMINDYVNTSFQGKDWLREIRSKYRYAEISSTDSSNTLFSYLNIQTISVNVDSVTKGVEVVASWSTTNDYIWIDGSIRGDLYTNNGKLAGSVYLNLPIGGTKSIQSPTVDKLLIGHCAKPKTHAYSYVVKYEPNNLWCVKA